MLIRFLKELYENMKHAAAELQRQVVTINEATEIMASDDCLDLLGFAKLYVCYAASDGIANDAEWCKNAAESIEDIINQPADSKANELIKSYLAAIQAWYELDEADRISVRKAERTIENIEGALADEGFTIFDGPATYVAMMESEDSYIEDSEDGYVEDSEDGYVEDSEAFEDSYDESETVFFGEGARWIDP